MINPKAFELHQNIKRLIIFLVICLIVIIGYLTVNGIIQKDRELSDIQTLPTFSFNDIKGNSYTDKLIYTNNSFLIIYFHPDCDYCHYEVEQIVLNMDQFSMHQIIMIATATRKSLEEFTHNHHITEFDNISVLIDTLDGFYEAFGPHPSPTSFIYNKDKNLVKRFEGEVSTEALLKFLNR